MAAGDGHPDQVTLFNATTAVTVVLGVVSLYPALFVLTLAGCRAAHHSDATSEALGADVGVGDYLKLAWFVSSL